MEKLKIGDRLYNVKKLRWSDDFRYRFEKVVRLTKTQAILSNGTRLVNEPMKYYLGEPDGYPVYGDNLEEWYFETEEILAKAKLENEKQAINDWFGRRNFTRKEKEIIYKTFKELDIL